MAEIIYGQPDPSTPIPTTLAGLIAILQTLTSVDLGPGATAVETFVAQQNIPSTAQQGSLWIRLSSSGAVLGFYSFFSGRWCKSWPFNTGMCMYLRTDPTSFFNPTTGLGLFDSGTPGLAGDFYGWKLRLNSDTSAVSSINRFILNAQGWNGTSFVALLPDQVTIANKGDKNGDYVALNNVPLLPALGREYDPTAAAANTPVTGSPRMIVSNFYKGGDLLTDPTASGVGSVDPVKFSGTPPFIVYGLIEWIGPQYTDPTVPLNV